MNLSTVASPVVRFARHEAVLAYRDFMRMMTAGKVGRDRAVGAFILLACVAIHMIAYLTLKPVINGGMPLDRGTLLILTSSFLLTFSLMASQALELVTRMFYSRSDLDLVLASPASVRTIFSVKIGVVAIATCALSVLLFGPAINVLAYFLGAQWLAAYLAIIACACLASAFSIAVMMSLYKLLGAARTRLIAQIVAAVVGAGFIIGVQIAAISSIGSISRTEFLRSESIIAVMPDVNSPIWLVSRAISGEIMATVAILAGAAAILLITIDLFHRYFAEIAAGAAGVSHGERRSSKRAHTYRALPARANLRRKEIKLLFRDRWLISQSMMQLLYLVPPAFMLWQGFGSAGALNVVVAPVIVMACGQLAGGLAWLAVSGEDAPELVQTAPVTPSAIIRAKVEAVFVSVFVIALPFLLVIGWIDLRASLITTAGIIASTVSATAIQLWFRAQANRSNFRRRQTSSKVATVAEAFSSIAWAGAAGLAITGSALWAGLAVFALLVLAISRLLRARDM